MMIPFCALGRGTITAILTHPPPLRSTKGHVNADGGSGTTLAGPGTDTSNYYYGGAPGGAHAGYGGRGQQHDDPQPAVAVLSPPSHTPYGNWSRPFDLGSRGSASSFCDSRVSALALVSLVIKISFCFKMLLTISLHPGGLISSRWCRRWCGLVRRLRQRDDRRVGDGPRHDLPLGRLIPGVWQRRRRFDHHRGGRVSGRDRDD